MIKNYLTELKLQLLNRNPFVWTGLILFTLLLLLGLSFFNKPSTPGNPLPTPSKAEVKPNAPPKLSYPKDKVDRMLKLVEKRTPLHPSDQAIRNRLIASLGSASGTLYETSRFKIEYVKDPDSFMVEVRTIDIQDINKDATKWFRDQGISADGICRFPIVFYPNIPLDILPSVPLTFNPIPEDC